MPGRINQGIQIRNPFSELSIENDVKQQRDIDPGFSVGGKQQRDIDPGFSVGGKDTRDIDPGFSFGEKQMRKAEAGMHGQISKSDLLDRLKISERAAKINKAITGPKADEKALKDALSGLDKKEREQLEKEYKKKYGKSLDDALRGKVSGSNEKGILSGLNGDEKTLWKQMVKNQNKNLEDIGRKLQ